MSKITTVDEMNSLLQPLQIKYLAVDHTSEADSMIQARFLRLKKACKSIQNCKIKIVDTANNQGIPASRSFLVSIDLTLDETRNIYTLRTHQSTQEDSLGTAVSDAFAMIYRQLIELQFE